jgi:hypothetical protein
MRGITRSEITIAGRNVVIFLERLFAIRRGIGNEAPALDELFQSSPGRGIVFDDEDAFGNGWRGASFRR